MSSKSCTPTITRVTSTPKDHMKWITPALRPKDNFRQVLLWRRKDPKQPEPNPQEGKSIPETHLHLVEALNIVSFNQRYQLTVNLWRELTQICKRSSKCWREWNGRKTWKNTMKSAKDPLWARKVKKLTFTKVMRWAPLRTGLLRYWRRRGTRLSSWRRLCWRMIKANRLLERGRRKRGRRRKSRWIQLSLSWRMLRNCLRLKRRRGSWLRSMPRRRRLKRRSCILSSQTWPDTIDQGRRANRTSKTIRQQEVQMKTKQEEWAPRPREMAKCKQGRSKQKLKKDCWNTVTTRKEKYRKVNKQTSLASSRSSTPVTTKEVPNPSTKQVRMNFSTICSATFKDQVQLQPKDLNNKRSLQISFPRKRIWTDSLNRLTLTTNIKTRMSTAWAEATASTASTKTPLNSTAT